MNKNILGLTIVTILAVSLLLNSQVEQTSQFQLWKQTYGSSLSMASSQQLYRKIIFQKNLQIINKHNSDLTQTYKMGINQFTIYTDQQFAAIFLTSKFPSNSNVDLQAPIVGADIDWLAKGMVSGVKNQGSCGSCWAFSAIASVQSFFRTKSQQVSLSQQQLVDCSGSYGNHGCNGGSHVQGMKYVKDHGVLLQTEYPYVGKTQACRKNGGPHKISNVDIAKGCTGMQNALMNRPLGVAVDAGGWNKYTSGIFSNCGTSLNHAVQLVGSSSTYWKIKNSWGTSWGEHGFIRLALGNTCGMCSSDGSWAI